MQNFTNPLFHLRILAMKVLILFSMFQVLEPTCPECITILEASEVDDDLVGSYRLELKLFPLSIVFL